MKYILWDIDGVFNPFMATNLVERGFIRFQQDWVSWDLDLINHANWMRTLEQESSFIWASTWGEESNNLIKWFHLEALSYPHIPLTMTDKHNGTWKLSSVKKWAEANVSKTDTIIWVDDELFDDAYSWAKSRGNTLLIKPQDSVGLTAQHVEEIQVFLQQ